MRVLVRWRTVLLLLAVLVALPARAALPADRLVVPLDLREGAFFGPLVEAWGIPSTVVHAAALPHHDLARIRSNADLAVVLEDGEALPVAIRYAVDEDHNLLVRRDGASWTAQIDAVPYVVREASFALDIRSSLWEAGLSAGLRPTDLVRLAQIYEYEVDFNTEIQAGARVGIVGQVLSTEGRPDKLGTIFAVRLVNGGRSLDMIRFPTPEGEEQWYHPDGTSAVRAFLRSPLEFSRVTSGFNPKRFHPILKERRPHNGTDFGAPSGTPVRSVADGVVSYAGSSGGHGNFVKLQHADGYETSYSHLSSIAVRRGERVKQGALVGRVGTTGLSTGPHLHFQMWKHGRFVDPMREVPKPTRPLDPARRPAFDQVVATWQPKLESTTPAPVAAPKPAR